MTVLRDILSSVLSSDAITRFFTTLVSASSMNYSIPSVSLTGDYKITVLAYFIDATLRVTGVSTSFDGLFTVNADGSILWRPEGSSTGVSASAGSVPSFKLSEIVYERDGSNGTINVNGVEVFNGAVPTGTLVIDLLNRQSGSRGDGILADIGIDDAGTPVRFYAIDEDLSTTTTIVDSISGQDGTAANITSSDFYQLNNAGTIWENQSGGSDLDVA